MARSAEDVYTFQQPLLRDGAYQLMPPSVRVRLHDLAAARDRQQKSRHQQ